MSFPSECYLLQDKKSNLTGSSNLCLYLRLNCSGHSAGITALLDPDISWKKEIICQFYNVCFRAELHFRVCTESGQIHQFNIRGLFFTTGSRHEFGVKKPRQLLVYSSVVHLKQSEVHKIRQQFRSFFTFYYLYGICPQETASLKALVHGLPCQTTDTATSTLSTALVLGSCSRSC